MPYLCFIVVQLFLSLLLFIFYVDSNTIQLGYFCLTVSFGCHQICILILQKVRISLISSKSGLKLASLDSTAEKCRSFLNEVDVKNINWKYGSAPSYNVVNKLFEEGRTKIWPPGSLEEKVQNLVKTWEMEMFHKVDYDDFKSVDPNKYRFNLNGRKLMAIVEMRKHGGGYNALLQTSLPEKLRLFNSAEETEETAHRAFSTTFPRGFALEILEVFSGPPVIVYKFRHWGFMEGPFKGHRPTVEMVEFFGMAIFEVVRVEFFFDRGELLGGLVKGSSSDDVVVDASASRCPVLRNTG